MQDPTLFAFSVEAVVVLKSLQKGQSTYQSHEGCQNEKSRFWQEFMEEQIPGIQDMRMTPFRTMLKRVCNKPGMYVGRDGMPIVRAFLDGYAIGLAQAEGEKYSFRGFQGWVQHRYGICHPAWGWDRILVHAGGSEREAVRTLPDLYELFLSEVASGTFQPGQHVECTDEPAETCTKGYYERATALS